MSLSAGSSLLKRIACPRPFGLAVALLLPFAVPLHATDQWIVPTPEELHMTSQPEVPGAPAVILNYEEQSDDILKVRHTYVRLKVLSEEGKEWADVELPYLHSGSVEAIEGRTIEPDGTVVPFAGKPYKKTLLRNHVTRVDAKVFTMPAVQVGSILEYRYDERWDDRYLEEPLWLVQQPLFVRSAYYAWKPFKNADGFGAYVMDATGNRADQLAWAVILPQGEKVQRDEVAGKPSSYELTIHNVAPLPFEEWEPPMRSVSMRVAFYYTSAHSGDEYWRDASKMWTKKENEFVGPHSAVKDESAKVTASATTPNEKLRKLYADVMSLDNTDYSRSHDRSDGHEPRNTDDILAQKRGSGDQLTGLFVAMARAAGFRADVVRVPNRERRFLWKDLLNINQMDDYVAVVTVDGKDMFFDPGMRYCPFGQMSWEHSMTEGLRESANGAEFVSIPGAPYKASQIQRTADLKLSPEGVLSGDMKVVYMGSPALELRTELLRSDEAALKEKMRDGAAEMVAPTMKVTLVSVTGTTDYEQPLVAVYHVEGTAGTSMSKRMVMPAQFFGAQATPMFTAGKRLVPIDMHYTSRKVDAVRITLPAGMHWEATPKPQQFTLNDHAVYASSFQQAGNALTMRRELDMAEVIVAPADYVPLHEFFGKVAAADSEQTMVSLSPGGSGTTAGAGSVTPPTSESSPKQPASGSKAGSGD